MNKKNLLIVFIIFLVLNFFNYKIIMETIDDQINSEFDKSINDLKTHYEIFLYQQKNASTTIFNQLSSNKKILNMLSDFDKNTIEQNNLNRTKLFNFVKRNYNILNNKDIAEVEFISKHNISFLKLFHPLKHGKNIIANRPDIAKVNKTQKSFFGFHESETSHGFRYIYPLLDENNNHIGALDISYSSDMLQYHLTNISKIHTHFLVDKNIFKERYSNTDEFSDRYTTSAEDIDSMLTITKKHSKQSCVIDNHAKLAKIKHKIDKGILKGELFSLYNFDPSYNNRIKLISFYPIKNSISKKTISWLISYSYSDAIKNSLENVYLYLLISLIATSLFIYFIYNIISKKEKLTKIVDEKTKELKHINDNLENVIYEKTNELNELNKNLEIKVLQEVSKNKEKEAIIGKQARVVALGEMMDAIAHQWQQPLSAIKLYLYKLELEASLKNEISSTSILETNDKVNKQIEHLVSTMNEFRSFFRPNAILDSYVVKDMIQSVLNLMKDDLQMNDIEVDILGLEDINILCINNEFKHVFINLISNSKDAFIQKNIQNRKIVFEIIKNDNKVIIKSFDNAGGIPQSVLPNVFKSNYTTKASDNGTGIGLYLCKQIIEKINATIKVENINDGVSFIIEIPEKA